MELVAAEDQDGSTPKLKEQLGHLLHYIQGQCQKDSPSVHQEPDEAPLAGPRQLPAPSTCVTVLTEQVNTRCKGNQLM